MLPAAHGTRGHQPVRVQAHHEVATTQARPGGRGRHRVDPAARPRLNQLPAAHPHRRRLRQLARHLSRALDSSIIEAEGVRLAFPRRTSMAQQATQPVVVTSARHVHGAAHRPGTNQLPTRKRILNIGARRALAAHSDRPRDCAGLLALQRRQILNGIQR